MKKGGIFLRIILNSLLGLGLFFLWTRFVNLEETFRIISGVEVRFLLLFVILFLFSGVLRSLRLRILLKKHSISYKDLLMLNFLSQFLSFMIPIRLGELTKSVYLTTQMEVPLARTLIWVFVDRFLDFWMVSFLISVFLVIIPTTLSDNFVALAFILMLIFTLIFVLAIKSEVIFTKLTIFLSNFLIFSAVKRWFVLFTHNMVEGFEILRRRPLELLGLTLLTLLATLSDSLIWMLGFLSLGENIGLGKSILGNALAALSFIIPAAPGYVGSAEAATLAIFSGVLGLETNLVSAVSVVFHILTLVIILICGLLALHLLKFDLGLVWKKLKREE